MPHKSHVLTSAAPGPCCTAGGPITIVELDPNNGSGGGGAKTTVLGRDLAAGEKLQHVVPPGTWFGAAPCEGTEYALVGCTVAPGEPACGEGVVASCARLCEPCSARSMQGTSWPPWSNYGDQVEQFW